MKLRRIEKRLIADACRYEIPWIPCIRRFTGVRPLGASFRLSLRRLVRIGAIEVDRIEWRGEHVWAFRATDELKFLGAEAVIQKPELLTDTDAYLEHVSRLNSESLKGCDVPGVVLDD
jgi:hypothetical protein